MGVKHGSGVREWQGLCDRKVNWHKCPWSFDSHLQLFIVHRPTVLSFVHMCASIECSSIHCFNFNLEYCCGLMINKWNIFVLCMFFNVFVENFLWLARVSSVFVSHSKWNGQTFRWTVFWHWAMDISDGDAPAACFVRLEFTSCPWKLIWVFFFGLLQLCTDCLKVKRKCQFLWLTVLRLQQRNRKTVWIEKNTKEW